MIDPLWGQFSWSAAGVIGAGILIGRISGELGERFRLGRAWAGTVLLSVATTLPEFVAILTVALRGEISMAIGGILGSIIFNLFILVWVDGLSPQPIYARASGNHRTTGMLGCGLILLIMIGLGMREWGIGGSGGFGIGHIGVIPPMILIAYLFGQYRIYNLARSSYRQEEAPEETFWRHLPLWGVIAVYAVLLGVIFISAYNLGVAADGLAGQYSLGRTFAGATLIGIVTSLPEMTNGIICARRREYDLAIGNVLGANAFVCVILLLADVLITEGRLFSLVAHSQVRSALVLAMMAFMMQGVVLSAIKKRSKIRFGRFSSVSIILSALYLASLWISYSLG